MQNIRRGLPGTCAIGCPAVCAIALHNELFKSVEKVHGYTTRLGGDRTNDPLHLTVPDNTVQAYTYLRQSEQPAGAVTDGTEPME